MLKPRCARKPVTAWTIPLRSGHASVRMKLDVEEEVAVEDAADASCGSGCAGGAVLVADMLSRSVKDRSVRRDAGVGAAGMEEVATFPTGVKERVEKLEYVLTNGETCDLDAALMACRAHKAIPQTGDDKGDKG